MSMRFAVAESECQRGITAKQEDNDECEGSEVSRRKKRMLTSAKAVALSTARQGPC